MRQCRVVDTKTGKVYEPNLFGVIRILDADQPTDAVLNGSGEVWLIVFPPEADGQYANAQIVVTNALTQRLKVQYAAGSYVDKNGEQLWENDRVSHPNRGLGTVVWDATSAAFCVFWDNGSRIVSNTLANVVTAYITRVGNTLLDKEETE